VGDPLVWYFTETPESSSALALALCGSFAANSQITLTGTGHKSEGRPSEPPFSSSIAQELLLRR